MRKLHACLLHARVLRARPPWAPRRGTLRETMGIACLCKEAFIFLAFALLRVDAGRREWLRVTRSGVLWKGPGVAECQQHGCKEQQYKQ